MAIPFILLLFFFLFNNGESKCRHGCDLAVASYYIPPGSNLSYISTLFSCPIPDIVHYNYNIPDPDSIQGGTRIRVPFSCDCLNGDFLGHTFHYVIQKGDTYTKLARDVFSNLTTDYWIQRLNVYDPTHLPHFYPLNITVNCSCGDRHVSRDYGLFETRPLRPGENLPSLAAETGVPADLIQGFNRGSDFNSGSDVVFLPTKG